MPTQEEILDEIRALASAARTEGREAVAVELLHRYLAHRPRDGFMFFIFGESLRILGLSDEAEVAYHRALQLAPKKTLNDQPGTSNPSARGRTVAALNTLNA